MVISLQHRYIIHRSVNSLVIKFCNALVAGESHPRASKSKHIHWCSKRHTYWCTLNVSPRGGWGGPKRLERPCQSVNLYDLNISLIDAQARQAYRSVYFYYERISPRGAWGAPRTPKEVKISVIQTLFAQSTQENFKEVQKIAVTVRSRQERLKDENMMFCHQLLNSWKLHLCIRLNYFVTFLYRNLNFRRSV